MKVVIPLAGKGARLRPHTHVTPKPLLRVAGRPLMSYILDDLRTIGVSDAVFVTGHLGDKIEEYVHVEYPDLESRFIFQRRQDGTAGALSLCEPFISDEFFIVFVDTLFDADLSIVKNLPADVDAVIWAKEVPDPEHFGVIETDADGFMVRIVEKPTTPVSNLANIGLYYIKDWRRFFGGVHATLNSPPGPGGEYFITDAFQYMVNQGDRIKVVHVNEWFDAGTPQAIRSTSQRMLENGRARKRSPVEGVTIIDPVRVEDGCVLEQCTIGPNVTLGHGCKVRNSVIRDSIVGDHAVLTDCDLRDSLVGSRASISGVRGTIDIGDDSKVNG